MQIKFKKGFRVKGDPNQVYTALENIRHRNRGVITPEAVLQAAKRKNNPLHSEFEWDNSKAAKRYRLEQARYIVRSIEVVHEKGPVMESRVYEITSGRSENKEGAKPVSHKYKTLDDILSNKNDRAAMVDRARRDLRAWLHKYGMLDELQDVIDTVRGAVE